MNFCSTENQIADIFTKALSREQFERIDLNLDQLKQHDLLINSQWLARNETVYETGGSIVCSKKHGVGISI